MARHINTIWFVLVALILSLTLFFPQWLSRESISGFLDQMGAMAIVVYVLLCLTRSLLLLPSTPFILAGAVSFPQSLFLIALISFLGIVVGGFLVYSFPSFGSYDELLEEKYPAKIANLKRKMHSKYAFWIVAGWSFFPLVPTDAVCYVAGVAKMPFRKVAVAMLLGQTPVVAAYIFLGAEFGEWLRV